MAIADRLMFSTVRFTDFISVSTDPSDKSLGYSQPSAKRGLSKADFLGEAPQREPVRYRERFCTRFGSHIF
jgi:hypothetical protein